MTSRPAEALVDGANGTRQQWTAAADDPAPWAQIGWSRERDIASVQIWGPAEEAFDPQQSTAAALYGHLEFSNGTSVPVSGIAAGSGLPTVVAFPPRSASWVRLHLQRQIADALVGLREFTAYEVGETPPLAAPAPGAPAYSVIPSAESCSSSPADVAGPVEGGISLSCPSPGSSVSDAAMIRVHAPPGAGLTARVSEAGPHGEDRVVAAEATIADDDGTAEFHLDLGAVPQGPFAVKVEGSMAEVELAPFYVQLFHAEGEVTPNGVGSAPPTGMTLQFIDDFDEALSASQSGEGTTYATLKPEPWGGSQFGDAVFADPAWGADTLATLPGGYLRLRVQPVNGYEEHTTWGQRHVGGILSSQRFGGSGFSAQYGYFEARILGAPGPGAWSAFWMLNSKSGTSRKGDHQGEIDPVELYGHNTSMACHATHAWGQAEGSDGETFCDDLAEDGDWASEWHTYGVRVLPGGAEFFVDGVSVARLSQLANTDDTFYFMLDLALNGGWPVDLSAYGDTTDLYVDWVRVYT